MFQELESKMAKANLHLFGINQIQLMMYKKYLSDPLNTSKIGSIMSPSLHKVLEFLKHVEGREKFSSLIAELEVFKNKKQDPLGICLDFESYKVCFEELW